MDIQTFIDRLMNDLEPDYMLITEWLRSHTDALQAQGELAYGPIDLVCFIYNELLPCLQSEAPLATFRKQRPSLNRTLRQDFGVNFELSDDFFEVMQQVKEAFEASRVTAPPPQAKHKMKVAPSAKEVEGNKHLFRNLYTQAMRNNPEFLESPQIALQVLNMLISDESAETIQNDLVNFLGEFNIEIIWEMIEKRDLIKAVTKKLEQKEETLIRALPAVTIRTEKRRRKKQRGKQQPATNLDMLRSMGFDNDFVDELHMLGLREQAVAQPLSNVPFCQKRMRNSNLQEIKHKFYTEYIQPPPPLLKPPEDCLLPISAMEEWCQPAFAGMKRLNTIQTEVYEKCFFSSENMLVSAPTGAGKTNIALLAVLRVLKTMMNAQRIIEGDFKVVYVAPMKALAAEVTEKFANRLKFLGISVRELTGDMQLTRTELANTHVIVTTPEKLDVVTRKGDSFMPLIKLLILDEVHLLDDERGAVLETLVARTIRQVEISQTVIRILALSATLPNYYDVAEFLHVPPDACFFFDSEYRPIPLEQRFIGVKVVPNAEQQHNMMMEACYEKVLEQVKDGQQVMVFVHSRRDTVKTAISLHDKAVLNGDAAEFECCYTLASKKEVEKSKNRDVRQLFEYGFGVHNAGMLRKDRSLTEKLFLQKNIKVLVTTATLAWGVNLPAHAVVIKGTEIYDSAIGGYKDVGVLDVQQIFGRAGRPDFDESGLAVIITTETKVDRYINMLITSKPIESRFLGNLTDALNAEVSLGTVSSIPQAVRWLKYSFFYVRVTKNPLHYGIDFEDSKDDFKMREEIERKVINAAQRLKEARMIHYDETTQTLASTALGRTASNYYIRCQSIKNFNEKLTEDMAYNHEQFYTMFTESQEFEQLKFRPEEEQDLKALISLVNEQWLPVKRGEEATTFGKVIGLMYAYLTGYQTDCFSLVADMAYIVQNGTRILRALFEMCLKRFWGRMAHRLLNTCKMLERRVHPMGNPLRQFSAFSNIGGYTAFTNSNVYMGGYIKDESILRLERAGLTLEQFEELDVRERVYWMRNRDGVEQLEKFINYLPALRIDYTIYPITGTIVKLHLKLTPLFEWRERWHKQIQSYWIWVEDSEGEILHFEYYLLHQVNVLNGRPHELTFAVSINRRRPGEEFVIRCTNDHWLGTDTWASMCIDEDILPYEHVTYTPMKPLPLVPVTSLQNPEYEALYKFPAFNRIQTQAFNVLYTTDNNVLLGAPTGSGKTIVAEIAMLRMFAQSPGMKVIYVAPLKALAKERIKDWKVRMRQINKTVIELTGDFTPDMDALNRTDILITTPEKWDGITRNWQHREYVQKVALVIIDEIHLLGTDRGAVLEVIVSRMRYMSTHVDRSIRLIGLSTALSNARDLGAWLNVGTDGFFNFDPACRPVPLQVHVEGFPEKAYCPRMATMNRPAYNAIMRHSPHKPTLIFVSSRRQTRITAFDLIAICASEQDSSTGFLNISPHEMEFIAAEVEDANLKQSLMFGIGQHHAGLSETDRTVVEQLFVETKILVLVATSTLAWGVNFPAHLVIIKGTEYYEPKLKKYVDFPITDVLQMMGRAGRPQFDDNGVACIFVQEEKKAFIKTFLYQPFPVESSLAPQLHDHLNAEIAAATLTSKQACLDYLTWTYFYTRLTRNHAYYGLAEPSTEGVNKFLAELVDKVLSDLQLSQCVEIDEDGSLRSTKLGEICSYYYITYRSVSILSVHLAKDLTFQQLLELISQLPEFTDVPTRHNEECFNDDISRAVPYPVDRQTLDSPYTKTYLLLQAHFTRVKPPVSDYITDTKLVIDQSIRIIHSMVDVCMEVGHLTTALRVMTISQMVCQGQWHYDSSLRNLPGLSLPHIRALHNSKHQLRSLGQLLELPEGSLLQILQELRIEPHPQLLPSLRQLPKLRVTWDCEEPDEQEDQLWVETSKFSAGSLMTVKVTLHLEHPEMASKPLLARTGRQTELGFWLMIGCTNSDKVLEFKQIHVPKKKVTHYRLRIQVPENPSLSLFCICDSYLGIDQEYKIN